MVATVAFDIGGTTTRIAIDDDGRRTYRERPTRIDASRALLPHLIECLDTTVEDAGIKRSDIAAVGIGMPGTVDSELGTVRLASNLHIGDTPLPLRSDLRSHIDVPIVIENDVKTAALGLVAKLDDPEHGVLTYLSIGTGIASATVINGTVLRGAHGSAGEIGQIQLKTTGRSHGGSLPGALEPLAAGPALGGDHPEGICFLARAIHTLFMLFDPDLLVLGGGATARQDIQTDIIDAVSQLRLASPTTAALIEMERLVFLDPEEQPGIQGAFQLSTQIPEMSDRSIRSAQPEGETP